MHAAWAAALRLRGSRAHPHLPPLIVMTDAARQPDARDVLACLPPGAALCLRDYGLAGRAALAHDLARTARARGVRFMVAGDVRLAIACGAWGVHLPEALARRRRLPLALAARHGLAVTMAAHSQRAAAFAAREVRGGIDAIVISPVFATRSHPDAAPLGPLGFLRIAAAAGGLPAYGLGGLTAAAAARLAPACPAGIAGIGF